MIITGQVCEDEQRERKKSSWFNLILMQASFQAKVRKHVAA